MQILFLNCILDKFAFIAHSKMFTVIKDINQNDFSKQKIEKQLSYRFEKAFWSISLIRVKLCLCAIKANLSGMQF